MTFVVVIHTPICLTNIRLIEGHDLAHILGAKYVHTKGKCMRAFMLSAKYGLAKCMCLTEIRLIEGHSNVFWIRGDHAHILGAK